MNVQRSIFFLLYHSICVKWSICPWQLNLYFKNSWMVFTGCIFSPHKWIHLYLCKEWRTHEVCFSFLTRYFMLLWVYICCQINVFSPVNNLYVNTVCFYISIFHVLCKFMCCFYIMLKYSCCCQFEMYQSLIKKDTRLIEIY